ncbi:hypothetical protein GW17_00032500 [Ensete ventricosum]|nr:hypothetical protein GW17_00032500 [Ensete ventricosum]RZS06690.1 hypothetical protein BHM03_00037387 [Ensete ventricosum]
MSIHSGHGGGDSSDEEGEVFIDEDDIIQEIPIDEEGLVLSHPPTLSLSCPSYLSPLRLWGRSSRPGRGVGFGRRYRYLLIWSFHCAGHQDTVSTVTFSFDGQLLATGGFDGHIHVWDASSGSLKCTLEGSGDGFEVISSLIAHSNSVECIGLTPSSPWAATGSMDQKLIIWDLQRSSVRCACDHEVNTPQMRIDVLLILLSFLYSNLVFSLWVGQEGVTCLAWLGASQFVATGCVDGKVRVWDSLSGNCVRIFSGHTDTVQSLALSADGNSLVSVSDDGTARVFVVSEFG